MPCAFVRRLIVYTVAALAAGGPIRSNAGEPAKEIQEHQAMPRPSGEPALRLDVIMPRAIWGDWERVHFDYRIVNATKKPIQFEDGDPGRGFAGKITYLRGPRDKIRSFGAHWTVPPHYRPNFWGRPKTFDPGAVVHKQAGLEPAAFFGPLDVGKHALQVVVPVGRMTVDGKPTAQLASAPVDFDVTPLTPELRRVMEATPKDDAGVTLEPMARAVTPDKLDRSVKLRLVNGSKAVIRFPQYLDMDLSPTDAEYFGGDGRWHKESLGWCGTGMASKELQPNQTATILTYVPSNKIRFVRFTLQVTDNDKVAERGKSRQVASPVIELKE